MRPILIIQFYFAISTFLLILPINYFTKLYFYAYFIARLLNNFEVSG